MDGGDELLARAAAGEEQAIADLWTEHRPLAEHLARRTCRPCDVDDVVSEAFAKILTQLARGGGPRVSFRAYLVTAVRSASADMAHRYARTVPVDDVELAVKDPGAAPPAEVPHSGLRLESELLTEALTTLPPRWQLAVWWVTVEGRTLTEVGERLGLNANAAAALAFRAREGLRMAYLQLHVDRHGRPDCAPWRADLPALVRGRLGAARSADAAVHLDTCAPCRGVLGHLQELTLSGVAP